MKSSTVNISFNDELLQQIDQVARQESRSRSEFIREAARSYLERKQRWNQIFAFSESQVKRKNIKEEDITEEISDYRETHRKR
jgi:metal-responsive CopG/Arc/MetJ family transcriptional regulator